MAWSNVLLDDLAGGAVGEVSNPFDRTISQRVSRLTTSHFAVRLDDPLADRLLEADLLVKHYENDVLRHVHEITDVEEVVAEDGTKRIGVTAADASWRLGGRLIGKTLAGYAKTVPTDRGAIVAELLAAVNAENDTGVRLGTVQPSAADTAGPWSYKPLLEVLAELSAPLDGYDWQIAPLEPTVDGLGLAWATLNLYAAQGGLAEHAVFAYSDAEDDRGNVKSYTRTISKQGMVNTAYSLPTGDAGTGQVLSWFDGPARAKWHWREGVIPSDLVVDDLRDALIKEHVALRKIPREQIVFSGFVPTSEQLEELLEAGSPIPYVPRFGVDYSLGDVVPFRATVDGQTRVDSLMRVYGLDLQITDEGLEIPTVSLVPE